MKNNSIFVNAKIPNTFWKDHSKNLNSLLLNTGVAFSQSSTERLRCFSEQGRVTPFLFSNAKPPSEMHFLEKDLEQIIEETDNFTLQSKGLQLTGKMRRQFRIGNYGVSDLITYKREYFHSYSGKIKPKLVVTVCELKKNVIDQDAFWQSVRYAKGIVNFLRKRNIEFFEVKIVLIGKKIEKNSSFLYLPDLFQNTTDFEPSGNVSDVSFYTYSYSVDGIEFMPEYGHSLSKEGF
jgi:hypothetical protein